MTDVEADDLPILRVAEAALAMVLQALADEDDPDGLALWIEVTGVTADAFTYDMYLQPAGDATSGDWSSDDGGLKVVVPAASIDKLRGAVLDVSGDGGDQGMVIVNPNRPRPAAAASPSMSGPPPALSGDVAPRVLQVLEQQINPSIAAHGGRADLVAVEDGAAYLRLSGGCAGCGMAAVTLSQGIEVALRESVPEVARVIDVTDHASGTNPYYEAAKK
jgi:Fe/S biogenesis protein NfuA